MRFTWTEGACILTVAVAAFAQSGDRGSRLPSPAPQAGVHAPARLLADLKPMQRQREFGHERATTRAGR